MTCRDCRYWDVTRAWGERKDKALCRALPPTIRTTGMACDPDAAWPTTRDDAWCGSFTKRSQE